VAHVTVTAEQFQDAVAARAAGTYWHVEATQDGFTVAPDADDPRWQQLVRRHGRGIDVAHRVRLRADGTFTVVDRMGSGGGPGVTHGREIASFSRTVSFSRQGGRIVRTGEDTYRGGAGRVLILGAAGALGLTERTSGLVRGAMVAAVLGGVTAVLALLLVVLAAAGR